MSNKFKQKKLGKKWHKRKKNNGKEKMIQAQKLSGITCIKDGKN